MIVLHQEPTVSAIVSFAAAKQDTIGDYDRNRLLLQALALSCSLATAFVPGLKKSERVVKVEAVFEITDTGLARAVTAVPSHKHRIKAA